MVSFAWQDSSLDALPLDVSRLDLFARYAHSASLSLLSMRPVPLTLVSLAGPLRRAQTGTL